jgi:hypothetical protein
MAKSKSEVVDDDPTAEAPEVTRSYGTGEVGAMALRIYVAYGATLGYKTLKGEMLPPWDQLHKVEQDAWTNAAFAALTGR